MLIALLLACEAPQATRSDGEPAPALPAAVQALRERRRASLREALGPARAAEVGGLFEADPTAGAAHYTARCAPCHGPQGAGDGPEAPGPLADLARDGGYWSNAELLALLREGWPEAGHPPMAGGLDEAALLALGAHLLRLREAGPPQEAVGRIR